jgi:3-phenylpropionate/trans-cinnamate dioxygenase ferredoxin subunit
MSTSDFEQAAVFEDLKDGVPVAVRLRSGEALCVIRVADEVFAAADRCSHADFPLSDGDMVDDYVIECSLHGAQFDVRSGSAVEPPAEEPLVTYEVAVRDHAVFVRPRPRPRP